MQGRTASRFALSKRSITSFARRLKRRLLLFGRSGDCPILYSDRSWKGDGTCVYVVDISCSMHSQRQTWIDETGSHVDGYRIDRAKAQVALSIKSLPDGHLFDVVAFSRTWNACFGSLQPADAAHKEAALAWLQRQDADEPSPTATGPCLAWALQHYPGRTYLLVNDGAPNVMEGGSARAGWQTHVALIQAANDRGATIHVLAVSPRTEAMAQFNQAVTAENGPGQLWVVGDDARHDPEPLEGLAEAVSVA